MSRTSTTHRVRWWVLAATAAFTMILWHLAIVSSIASKGDEPSPFGWFFYPAMLILGVLNVGLLAVDRRWWRHPVLVVVAVEAAAQIAYATFYRHLHHVHVQDLPRFQGLPDVSATVWCLPVLFIGAGLGLLLAHRFQDHQPKTPVAAAA